ncbi:hypothetical protein KFK09_000878 [Dendrobium nobile]|uniref:S-formylglutathione hydrolase n=1 Tax=Dendrobium nobile TaxID=94219 RepID=A0A8T3CCT5_DENNO|nr:hypothetical protein KFK09_000878 [Dendrobium nobile]
MKKFVFLLLLLHEGLRRRELKGANQGPPVVGRVRARVRFSIFSFVFTSSVLLLHHKKSLPNPSAAAPWEARRRPLPRPRPPPCRDFPNPSKSSFPDYGPLIPSPDPYGLSNLHRSLTTSPSIASPDYSIFDHRFLLTTVFPTIVATTFFDHHRLTMVFSTSVTDYSLSDLHCLTMVFSTTDADYSYSNLHHSLTMVLPTSEHANTNLPNSYHLTYVDLFLPPSKKSILIFGNILIIFLMLKVADVKSFHAVHKHIILLAGPLLAIRLTCTDENFIMKSGAQRAASAEMIALVAPDTSPRGLNIDGEADSWDFGVGAGFYLNATEEKWKNWRMYDYVVKELPKLLDENFKQLDTSKASIFGHSMGGHGALTIFLKNLDKYKASSAFSPIVNPINCPWGQKAFSNYLGGDKLDWEVYDATCLIAKYNNFSSQILIDQDIWNILIIFLSESNSRVIINKKDLRPSVTRSESRYRVQRDFCHIQMQLLLLFRYGPTSLLVFLIFTDKENLKSSVLAPMLRHVLLITSEAQPLCPLILHLLLCQSFEIFPTPSSYWFLLGGLITVA